MHDEAQTKRCRTGKKKMSVVLLKTVFKTDFFQSLCQFSKHCIGWTGFLKKPGLWESVHNWSRRPYDCGRSYCWDFSKCSHYGIFQMWKWIPSDNKYKPLKNIWLKLFGLVSVDSLACMFEQLYLCTSQRVNTHTHSLPPSVTSMQPSENKVYIFFSLFWSRIIRRGVKAGKGGSEGSAVGSL